MKRAKRKAVLRSKGTTRYSATAITKHAADFDVLHAAHRAQLAESLATIAADELRNVAQTLGLGLATARRGAADFPQRVAEAVDDAEVSLLTQIEKLDRFGNVAHAREPLALHDLVADAAFLACHAIDAKPATVKTELPADLPIIAGDRAEVTEIVYALLTNGCKAAAGRAGGQVRITAAADHGYVRLTVADNGPGISPAMKRHLFEPLVTTRQGGRHFGIGLAVARELAHRNGGELTLATTPVAGARFWLRLPRWESPRVVRRTRR